MNQYNSQNIPLLGSNGIGPANLGTPQPVTSPTPTAQPVGQGAVPTPTPAGGNPGAPVSQPTQQMSNPFAMDRAMFEIRQRLTQNQDLIAQKNAILKHLYESPLQDVSNLTPSQADAIRSGNRQLIDAQIRSINDQITGRNNTIDQAFTFLTNTQKSSQDALELLKSTDPATLYATYGQAGLDLLSQATGVDFSSMANGATDPNSPGSGALNVINALGIEDPLMPLRDVVSQYGVDAIIDAIIKNEGSSPKGVQNNPGNIKFKGLPGQIDSGVQASDGGTFASYETPEAGRQAIADIINRAAQGQSKSYGVDPSLTKFMNTYTNTYGKSTSTVNPLAQRALSVILASSKLTKDQKSDVTKAISSGEDPFTVVRNKAKEIMGSTDATTLRKLETARNQMENIKDLMTEYYANGGKTGLIKGNMEKTINNLGGIKDPKLVGIATRIAKALQTYRNAISGTAYSDQEGRDIASVFPGINKNQGLNTAILEANLDGFDQDIDFMYKNALGSVYEDFKKAESDKTAETGDQEKAGITISVPELKAKWAQVPAGEILVYDKKTGQYGSMPANDPEISKYIKVPRP